MSRGRINLEIVRLLQLDVRPADLHDAQRLVDHEDRPLPPLRWIAEDDLETTVATNGDVSSGKARHERVAYRPLPLLPELVSQFEVEASRGRERLDRLHTPTVRARENTLEREIGQELHEPACLALSLSV